MSIRLRLTLFYTAILVLTLLVFGTMLYFVQADFTYASIKRDLATNSDRVVQSINRALQRMPPPTSTRPSFIPIPAELLGESTFKDLRVRDVVRILGTDGTLMASGRGPGSAATARVWLCPPAPRRHRSSAHR